MKIVVVGSGAVGGYFGGRLAARGADVTFVARGAHLAALTANGLRIESREGDLHLPAVSATSDTSVIGPTDVVLFAVKLYDVPTALAQLPPLIGPETMVVPLQNGITTVDLLRNAVGESHTAGGTCYVSAVMSAPGIIRHTAMGRLIFGPLEGEPSRPLRDLYDCCAGAGFEAVLSDCIQEEIWAKFVRLTAFSGVTAAARSPIGIIMADPDLSTLLTAALEESFAVARASGIQLDPAVIPAIVASYRSIPPGMKSSLLEDLERGRRLELPFLSGTIARLGSQLGVPTPSHRFIATVLKPFANPTAEQ